MGWDGMGWDGRGGEGSGAEGSEEGGMTVIHIVMASQYLNSNHVTYYVITCKSAFDWVYAEQWYVSITSDVNWTATRIPSQINSHELVYKPVMSIPVRNKYMPQHRSLWKTRRYLCWNRSKRVNRASLNSTGYI